MRVQGINPVCGKLKFRGAKDTENFFMHKSISVWLSKMQRTCTFCLNACCQGPRRFCTVYTFHIRDADSLSFPPSLPVSLICSMCQQQAHNSVMGVKCRPGSNGFFKQIPFPHARVDWSGGTASAVPNASTDTEWSKAQLQTLPTLFCISNA